MGWRVGWQASCTGRSTRWASLGGTQRVGWGGGGMASLVNKEKHEWFAVARKTRVGCGGVGCKRVGCGEQEVRLRWGHGVRRLRYGLGGQTDNVEWG